eukprot:CAMPEP_0114588154 /NCGR_PEP_ID=MMETSP0125-20121206/10926_1 /TAXON_ID=485358 ORGANISM="Aristerostoma sp., Strain ATCC 50986" /NCGR_SAMPLE_ID=MMETSP0125 /ASSEMBLY_ACC=CAM_ASM_000245 /LENGTH=169 /DNA_ID=CAMNT_0001784405 /DNA_START=906 /DNA_END=1415 /DNA_ORIENTATION=-
MNNLAGTPYYMAPEISKALKDDEAKDKLFKEGVDTFAADLFSLGMTILKTSQPNLNREKFEDYRDTLFLDKFPQLHDAICALTSTDPQERYKALSLIEDYDLENDDLGMSCQQDMDDLQVFLMQEISSQKLDAQMLIDMFMLKQAEQILGYHMDHSDMESIKFVEFQVA